MGFMRNMPSPKSQTLPPLAILRKSRISEKNPVGRTTQQDATAFRGLQWRVISVLNHQKNFDRT
ncbi:MAG: hypothetical protein ACFNM7_07905 [Prevotella conceptionensis]